MTNQEKALELHEKLQGKLETVSKTPVRTREDLALVYTPGVAEPCKVIAKDPAAAYTYTMKANTVAVVSDCTTSFPAVFPMFLTKTVSFAFIPSVLVFKTSTEKSV